MVGINNNVYKQFRALKDEVRKEYETMEKHLESTPFISVYDLFRNPFSYAENNRFLMPSTEMRSLEKNVYQHQKSKKGILYVAFSDTLPVTVVGKTQKFLRTVGALSHQPTKLLVKGLNNPMMCF